MLRRFMYFFFTSPPALTFAGYLANWKMFDPRKLIPFSIEYCNAPIAVITEITEKTPMVIPNMVRPERSLFTPNEPRAIVIVSLKRMAQDANREIRNAKQISAQIRNPNLEIRNKFKTRMFKGLMLRLAHELGVFWNFIIRICFDVRYSDFEISLISECGHRIEP